MTGVEHFEGTCDVCGEDISLDWDYTNGIIDIGIDDEPNVRPYTWIRHYPKAPPEANPDCAIYSSKVWLVKENKF